MAEIRYMGTLAAVAQVATLTIGGTLEAGDKFKVTLTGEMGDTYTFVHSATSTTIATVVAGFVAQWNLDGHPLVQKITAAAASPDITLTADTAGEPFTYSITTTESDDGVADDQTFANVDTTASQGPYDAGLSGNWADDNGQPILPGSAANHEVFIENATVKYGLDFSDPANNWDHLTISNSQVGENPVKGWRGTYLRCVTPYVYINRDNHPGSRQNNGPTNVFVDDAGANQAVQPLFNVYASGSNNPSYYPTVNIKSNDQTAGGEYAIIRVHGGIVGIGDQGTGYGGYGATTISKVIVYGGDCYVGDGVTWDGTTELRVEGGSCIIAGAAAPSGITNCYVMGNGRVICFDTTLVNIYTQGNGSCTAYGGVTNIDMAGGTVNYYQPKDSEVGQTISTLQMAGKSTLNCWAACTFTDVEMDGNGNLLDLTKSQRACTVSDLDMSAGDEVRWTAQDTITWANFQAPLGTQIKSLSLKCAEVI